MDNSDKIEFWTIEELRESAISIFEYIPKGICVLNSLPSHEVCQTPGTLQPCHQHHMLLMMIMYIVQVCFVIFGNTELVLIMIMHCTSMFYNIWKYRAGHNNYHILGGALSQVWRCQGFVDVAHHMGPVLGRKQLLKSQQKYSSHFYFLITWGQFWDMSSF